jgi:hypothetical protein
MVPTLGSVTTSARMNIRTGAPSTTAPVVGKVPAGTVLTVRGVVHGDDVLGNADWYAGIDDTFFWSGATYGFVPQTTSGAGGPLAVHRRPNGTIRPLSDAEIRSVFGNVTHTEKPRGRVELDPAWVAANIVEADTPLLASVGYPKLSLHRKAAQAFLRVLDAIAAAGLTDRLITCDGTFVPRHKGWDPNRTLSSHTWGIAIDLNAQWNGYGTEPAVLGAHGSVRELVALFEAEGFAWGGYFEPETVRDGMHFELARLSQT